MRMLFATALALSFQSSPAVTVHTVTSGIQRQQSLTSPIKIANFGKVNDSFYRGAQPKKGDYANLAAMGIKTVIDLRLHPEGYAGQLAERAGLRYINLPMNVRQYPSAETTGRFLALVTDPVNRPVYVYCDGGRHRTGAMIAVYRMTIEGWDIQRAYQEMRQYGFYKRWRHGSLKSYVFDYYRQLKEKHSPSPQ